MIEIKHIITVVSATVIRFKGKIFPMRPLTHLAKAQYVLWLAVACLVGSAAAQQLPQAAAGGAAATGIGAGATGFTMGGMTTGGVPSIRASDPLNPQQVGPANPSAALQPEPLKPNDFQKFVLETAGFKLPLYGQAFFDNLQFSQQRSTQTQQATPLLGAGFAPVDNAPVSNDYLLGPGDQVLIRGWGSLDIDVRAVIDRNGMVSLPRVGAVSLAGVKAAQAEGLAVFNPETQTQAELDALLAT